MTTESRLMLTRASAFLSAAFLAVAIAACGGGSSKTYDISPIFPATPDKCAKYGGTQEGSGVTETCKVTKEECERAAGDWNAAMREGGVNDAIEFSC